MEKEHRKQLDEVSGKIEELQRQLEEERERHERAAGELKEKRRELDDDQQKFLQQQIDEQNKRFASDYIAIDMLYAHLKRLQSTLR